MESMQHSSKKKKIVIASVFALVAGGALGTWLHLRGAAPSQESTSPAGGGETSPRSHTQAKTAASPITGRSNSGTDADLTPSVPGAAPVAAAPEVPLPPPEVTGCFKQSFRHEKLATHDDGEECLKHRNQIRIQHDELKPAKIGAKSVCIRVNGQPVRFTRVKGHPDQFIIGPEAGPQAEISVSYCVGKTTYPEDCTVKRDDFLAAIGGETDAGGAGWDNSAEAKKHDAELESEMAALQKEMGGNGVQGGVFRGWKAEKVQTRAIANAH